MNAFEEYYATPEFQAYIIVYNEVISAEKHRIAVYAYYGIQPCGATSIPECIAALQVQHEAQERLNKLLDAVRATPEHARAFGW